MDEVHLLYGKLFEITQVPLQMQALEIFVNANHIRVPRQILGRMGETDLCLDVARHGKILSKAEAALIKVESMTEASAISLTQKYEIQFIGNAQGEAWPFKIPDNKSGSLLIRISTSQSLRDSRPLSFGLRMCQSSLTKDLIVGAQLITYVGFIKHYSVNIAIVCSIVIMTYWISRKRKSTG